MFRPLLGHIQGSVSVKVLNFYPIWIHITCFLLIYLIVVVIVFVVVKIIFALYSFCVVCPLLLV
jgi:hypothetical protein